jgi:hypothetical protein
MRTLMVAIVLGAMVVLGGCQTNYCYKITDNQTHKDFYEMLPYPPTKFPRTVALTDPETGATTITSEYTVTPISATEYEANRPKYVQPSGGQSSGSQQ